MNARPSLEPPASDVAGWRLVPVEPTDEMLRAMGRAIEDAPLDDSLYQKTSYDADLWVVPSRDAYRAMIAAAPPHPASKEVGDE